MMVAAILSGVASVVGIIGMGTDGDAVKGRWVATWIVGLIARVVFGMAWSLSSM